MASSAGVWTGAVGEKSFAEVPPTWAKDTVGTLLKENNLGLPGLGGIELLLYAEAEWGDHDAGNAARAALRSVTNPVPDDAARLARLSCRALADGSPPEPADAELGSLGAVAARVFALCGSFQMTADPRFRTIADALVRGMFQELWERERGGFFSFAPKNGAPPPPIAPEENAAAFEAVWLLHHITGNPNYRKWLAWGIKGLAAECRALPAARQADLARVADMMARGRFYLELVGRPEDEKARALALAALGRYLPRRIVSWISPNDQDYIMAHKLAAPEYPCLFACADLKPVGSARKPEDVPVLLDRLYCGKNAA